MKQNRRKKLFCMLIICAVFLTLSGCSLADWLLSGCSWEDADLVFYNDSSKVVGSVAVHTDSESQTVCSAKEGVGLERGESWGFQLPEKEQDVILKIYDQQGRQLSQGRFLWPGRGKRLLAVYDGDIALRFQWDEAG